MPAAFDLFDYRDKFPDAPGYRQTDTSKAAAKSIRSRAATLRDDVLAVLQSRGPMATFEIASALPASYRSVQPRTSELRAQGKIQDSGIRRTDPETGRKAIVWEPR